MSLKSEFLNEIKQRGFIYQSSDIEDLDSIMQNQSITGYIGFDITSDSLHVGSLIQLMLLHWLDFYEHKAIALVGGGTTLVGDPSGKDKSRQILNIEDINKNISTNKLPPRGPVGLNQLVSYKYEIIGKGQIRN